MTVEPTLFPLAAEWLSADACAKDAAKAGNPLYYEHRADRADAERRILAAMREVSIEAFLHESHLFEVGKPLWPGHAPRLDVTHLYHSHEVELPRLKPEPAPEPAPDPTPDAEPGVITHEMLMAALGDGGA
jgi:hypothetical protein